MADPKPAKQDQKHKQVVDAQRRLNGVSGDKLQRRLTPLRQVQPERKAARHQRNEQAPYPGQLRPRLLLPAVRQQSIGRQQQQHRRMKTDPPQQRRSGNIPVQPRSVSLNGRLPWPPLRTRSHFACQRTCQHGSMLSHRHPSLVAAKPRLWLGSSRHFSHVSILWRTEERGRLEESFDGSESASRSGCRRRGRADRRSKPELAHSSARLLPDLCGKRLLGGGRELQQRSASKAFA